MALVTATRRSPSSLGAAEHDQVHISDIFRRLGVRNRIEAIAQLEACEAPLR